jgi:hypothetical protein
VGVIKQKILGVYYKIFLKLFPAQPPFSYQLKTQLIAASGKNKIHEFVSMKNFLQPPKNPNKTSLDKIIV